MSDVLPFPTPDGPREILQTLLPDADRMRAVVAVVLLEDGSWHVRHSNTQTSIVHSAAINLLRFVTDKATT
jgi:hypothetical protein